MPSTTKTSMSSFGKSAAKIESRHWAINFSSFLHGIIIDISGRCFMNNFGFLLVALFRNGGHSHGGKKPINLIWFNNHKSIIWYSHYKHGKCSNKQARG